MPKNSPIIIMLLLFVYVSVSAQRVKDITNQYHWKEVKLGAGGYVTGIDMQRYGNVMYCRTDVGGAYRLDTGSRTWIQLVTTGTMPGLETTEGYNDYGVQSIVSAPLDDNIVYMMFGDGCVYRSQTYGDTWTRKALQTYVEPNGQARFQGERLAVDPVNSDVVYYGSHDEGLFRTLNGGDSWETLPVPKGTSRTYGIGTVLIDPGSSTVHGRSGVVYVSIHGAGIYQSQDGGDTWMKLTGGPVDGEYEDTALGVDGACYVGEATRQEVWRYQNQIWTLIKSGHSIKDVACDPYDADRLIVTEHGGKNWRSTDGGKTWRKLPWDRISPDIPWQKWCQENWFSTAEFMFDSVNPGKVWIAQGIGVWFCEDIGGTDILWESMSMGIEELVMNDIYSAPGQVPLAACWDRSVMRLDNPDVYPDRYYPTSRFNTCWDLAGCASDPAFVAAAISDHRNCCPFNASGYTEDGGKTWTQFANIPADADYGTLAVSATDPDNIIWLPTDNVLPYYTINRGQSWTKSALPGTFQGGILHHASKQSVVTADAELADTFYLYHHEMGIYKSINKGASWELISTGLPMGAKNLSAIRAVSGQSGHFYFTAGSALNQPLYRSTDGCLTWNSLKGTGNVSLMALGKAAPGKTYPSIYIYGEVKGETGLWRSTDRGESWKKTGLHPLGIASKIVTLEGDKNTFGKIWVGFPGNGMAYGVDADSADSEIVETGGILKPNFPNPFRGKTLISYHIDESTHVNLAVHDINGRQVAVLFDDVQSSGDHEAVFNSQGLASGLYFCSIHTGSEKQTRKLILVQ